MKLNDLGKVKELVDKKEATNYKNNEIKKFLERHEEDIDVEVWGKGGYIFVDKEYVVAMFEKIKKDNDAIIEKVKQELKELGVEVE
jgi:Ni,Fe-hydrogenase maturation factor